MGQPGFTNLEVRNLAIVFAFAGSLIALALPLALAFGNPVSHATSIGIGSCKIDNFSSSGFVFFSFFFPRSVHIIDVPFLIGM